MNDFYEQAKAKLEREAKEGAYDRYAAAMKEAVQTALLDFAEQDDEFAQAIVQGGSFADCMKAVAKNCGTSISDIEAYGRAVSFYFPGAKIRVQMSIDLIGDAAGTDNAGTAASGGGIILNLSDFL